MTFVNSVTIKKGADGLRRMLLVSSNGYIDREHEHVTERALEQYVNSAWADDDYVGTNVLLFWHSDGHLNASRNAIGDIIYAEMIHGFLVEVAKERVDEIVDISRKGIGNKPFLKRVSKIWDAIEAQPDMWGASIGFAYLDDPDAPDEPDEPKQYEKIYKFETSVLPREYASNPYTLSKVVRQGNR